MKMIMRVGEEQFTIQEHFFHTEGGLHHALVGKLPVKNDSDKFA